jgi:hypothetical protein
MTRDRCDGESCCARWRELCEAYDEGRCEEVATEVKRVLAALYGEPVRCLMSRRLLHALKRDGWMEST